MQRKNTKTENILSVKELPPLNQRVKDLVDLYANGSVKKFSEIIDISSSQKLNRVFNVDKRNNEYPEVSIDIILSIANMLSEVNTEWLLTGNGNMLKTKIDIEVSNDNINEESSEKVLSRKKHINMVTESSHEYISENIISIPIVDVSAAAGHGYFNSDHPETLGELSFPVSFLKKKYGNYYCGRVDGESMEPTLLYGDFIIFRLLSQGEWADLKNGDVYFIVDRSGSSFVKRIKNQLKKEGVIICQSDNPDKQFRDFPIENDNIANIYHVEWRFSKDMTNINQMYFSRLDILEDQMKNIQEIVKKSIK